MTVIIILALILAFIIALVVRALKFRPAAEERLQPAQEVFDGDKAVEHLASLIRCRTVSYPEREKEDGAEFGKLYALLPQLFPNVYEKCECIETCDRGRIFVWKGKSADKPSVLMAHYDVVPVKESEWSKPAFEGIIENGELWGRGTLDTKGTFLGVIEAADNLIAQGFIPENDIYMCFAGNEEISGNGAPENVKWLESRGIRPEFILDEGGAVVSGIFPGLTQPCAVVGIAEKGPMNITLTADVKGGHASTPPARSAIGLLSRAVARIESHPFPFTLTAPALSMFDCLARRSGFLYRLIFANLWCFKPALDYICKKGGGELNALVRTTVAFTMAKGSDAFNVLPNHAEIGANLRIIPGETVDSVVSRLNKTIGDERVKVKVVYGNNPSAISRTDDEPWQRLSKAIRQTWTAAVPSPYLMLACSDSRHYCRISEHVYRFSAMELSKEERGMIHGKDERIPLDTIKKTVAFYQTLIRMC